MKTLTNSLIITLALAIAHPAFCLGDLTPPIGSPSPTMKTLDQVEPRTPLVDGADDTTAVTTSDADYHFVINESGSYYLSADLETTKANGIKVVAQGVTIDLKGFQINRSSGSGGRGILIEETADQTRVFNGTVRDFFIGIECPGSLSAAKNGSFSDLRFYDTGNSALVAGLAAVVARCQTFECGASTISAGDGSTLSDCVVADSIAGNRGFSIGAHCTLQRCTVSGGGVQNGIFTGKDCTLSQCIVNGITGGVAGFVLGDGTSAKDCTASENVCTYGFNTGTGCTLVRCTAHENTSIGSTSGGFNIGFDSNVSHCVASYTETTNGAPTGSTGIGFKLEGLSTITDCVANHNYGDGIQAVNDCIIRNNQVSNNGWTSGDGAGIHVTGMRCRIESNHSTANDRGYEVDGVDNLTIKNSSSLDTSPYPLNANSNWGPIVDLSSTTGSLASPTNGDHPFANFIL